MKRRVKGFARVTGKRGLFMWDISARKKDWIAVAPWCRIVPCVIEYDDGKPPRKKAAKRKR